MMMMMMMMMIIIIIIIIIQGPTLSRSFEPFLNLPISLYCSDTFIPQASFFENRFSIGQITCLNYVSLTSDIKVLHESEDC